MKVIVLDIDGVLNHAGTVWQYVEPTVVRHGKVGLDPQMVARLARIVNESGGPEIVKIVLHSSWKWIHTGDNKRVVPGADDWTNGLEIVRENLVATGFPYPEILIDRTDNPCDEATIWKWIRVNKPSAWVVLDDMQHEELLDGHLVETCWFDKVNGGLQDHHVEQAVRILNQ